MAGNINQVLKIHLLAVDKATAVLKRVEKTVVGLGKRLEFFDRRFMGLGFSLLFMGMAMNRAITGFISSTIDAYKQATDNQSVFNVKTNELAAAWGFFKFSLIDALNQSGLFVVLIDWLIVLLNWLSQLSPATRRFIVFGLAISAATTFVAMLSGQFLLLLVSLNMIKGLGIAGTFAFIITKVKALATALALATKKVWVLAAANIVWLAWIVSILALVVILVLLSEKFGGLGNALKAMAATAIVAFGLMGQALVEFILLPLQMIAVAIANILDFMGRKVPNILRNIATFKPDIIGTAATFAAKIQPKAVKTHEQVMSGLKEDFVSAFKEVMPDFKKAIEDGNDASTDKRGNIIPSTVS